MDHSHDECDISFRHFIAEFDEDFSGWNFSHINNRMVMSPLSWSYESMVRVHLIGASSLLDMGTGGGEFLSTLPCPQRTVATENYPPNIEIARRRLEPLGIEVVSFEDDTRIPLDDSSFDLIINRHESYSAEEVTRLLSPGALFVTQQVGNEDNTGINEFLGAAQPEDYNPGWTVEYLVEELLQAGMEVKFSRSEKVPTRIFDIGALVYYLKAIPWQIPDFSIPKYRDKLHELHHLMRNEGYFEILSQRYVIVAERPRE